MKKVQKFAELSSEDIEQLERGFLTINTLNRIEEKQQELKNLFDADAYFVEDFENKSWTYTDYFKQDDFDRILDNLSKLKRAYFVYSTTPQVTDNNYRRYQTINVVEHILNDLDLMISDVKSHYRQCGNVECREE
jgi:hypothetical protein